MTIKGLSEYFKKKAPNVFRQVPLAKFSKKKIAIDAYFILFKMKAASSTEVIQRIYLTKENGACVPRECYVQIQRTFIVKSLEWCMRLNREKINYIFVLDGEDKLDKKMTHDKRQEQRDKTTKEIEELRKHILDAPDLLEVSTDKVKRLKDLYARQITLSDDDIQLFKNTWQMLGMPYLKAVADGERVCSLLCREGKVDAVFSSDSDNMAHGAPCVIFDLIDNETVKIVYQNDILNALEMTRKEFLELCIMSGCDYNTNCKKLVPYKKPKISKKKEEKEDSEEEDEENNEEKPKKKEVKIIIDPITGKEMKEMPIGIGRAFDILKECKTIDNLPKEYQIECLNHVRCRELFSHVNSDSLIIEGNMERKVIQAENVRDYFNNYGMSDTLDRFLKSLE